MEKNKIKIFSNGKWIYSLNPGKRSLFHLLVSGPIIIFGGVFLISGSFPPPEDFESPNRIFFLPLQIMALLWIWWFASAFFTFFIPFFADKVNKSSEQEIRDVWQITTSSCPYCLKKIPRLASKCPHCTADLK